MIQQTIRTAATTAVAIAARPAAAIVEAAMHPVETVRGPYDSQVVVLREEGNKPSGLAGSIAWALREDYTIKLGHIATGGTPEVTKDKVCAILYFRPKKKVGGLRMAGTILAREIDARVAKSDKEHLIVTRDADEGFALLSMHTPFMKPPVGILMVPLADEDAARALLARLGVSNPSVGETPREAAEIAEGLF